MKSAHECYQTAILRVKDEVNAKTRQGQQVGMQQSGTVTWKTKARKKLFQRHDGDGVKYLQERDFDTAGSVSGVRAVIGAWDETLAGLLSKQGYDKNRPVILGLVALEVSEEFTASTYYKRSVGKRCRSR